MNAMAKPASPYIETKDFDIPRETMALPAIDRSVELVTVGHGLVYTIRMLVRCVSAILWVST